MFNHMRNLTLASAKHLLNAGHISRQHHADIVKKAAMPKAPKMPKTKMFGSLAQQAQAPIPGVGGPEAVPAGTATGYGNGGE